MRSKSFQEGVELIENDVGVCSADDELSELNQTLAERQYRHREACNVSDELKI